MFTKDSEAWANGLVVADIWHAEDKRRPLPAPSPLDVGMAAMVDGVVSMFGCLTGQQLILRTHPDGGP